MFRLIIFMACFISLTVRAEALELTRDSIINFAQTNIGVPYKWGGSSKKGFDCSGFVYYVFKHFGINVSRTSSGYKSNEQQIELENCKPADLILFTGTDSKIRKVGHLGIVLKNDDGVIDFIHSSSSKKHFGVCITRYNASGYEKRFLRIIDIL